MSRVSRELGVGEARGARTERGEDEEEAEDADGAVPGPDRARSPPYDRVSDDHLHARAFSTERQREGCVRTLIMSVTVEVRSRFLRKFSL